MHRRLDIVQTELPDRMVLPPHRIMQGVRPRIAPQTIEIVDTRTGHIAEKFEELPRPDQHLAI